MPKWVFWETIFELWEHQCLFFLCFHYWDLMTNNWHFINCRRKKTRLKTHLLPSYHIVGNFWGLEYWAPEYSLKKSSHERNWDPPKKLAIFHDKIKLKYELYQTTMFFVQGASDKTRIMLTSRLWKNQCWYWKKRYLSRKPLISALIWHPESGLGIIRRLPRPLAVKSIFCWILRPRGGFLTLCLLWHGHALLILPRPLSGCQIKAEIKGFLLRHRLLL